MHASTSTTAPPRAPEPWRALFLGQGPVPVVLALLSTALYSVFGVTRHLRFGSGSWDMGCYVHNLYLLAYGKPLVSSVLGDANFWGGTNHFMPSLILAAPLSYLDRPEALIVAQAALVAFAVVPLWGIGARLALSRWLLAAVSVAYLLAVGTQQMVNFDVHEIAPVPLLMFSALLLLMSDRLYSCLLVLLVLAGCKESCVLYAVSIACVGALHHRRFRWPLVVTATVGVLWFVVVVGVIQPHFLEPGASMLHTQRFAGGLSGTLVHMASHPFDALSQLVMPQIKLQTWWVTLSGFALLPILSPTFWLLSAPNVAERFLSDKKEMWGLGFHYSLVLVGCAALASLYAAAHLRAMRHHVPAAVARHVDHVPALLLAAGLLTSWASAPSLEFSTLHKPYMADEATVARYERALTAVPPCASVVAQNHFLPHLAHRQFIWQPQPRFVDRADVVILDERMSPWPHNTPHIQRLLARLRNDGAFRLAFTEDTTHVFIRNTFAGCGDV